MSASAMPGATTAHRSPKRAAVILNLSLEEAMCIVGLLVLDTSWPEIATRFRLHRERAARRQGARR